MQTKQKQSKATRLRKRIALSALAVFAVACSEPEPELAEQDLGPIEATLDEVAHTVWPGNVLESGVRHVRLLNGFFDGKPSAYWFAGFAPRATADVFQFCRQGDDACPFDERGAIDQDRIVGRPVFARMPGEVGFSPFWLVWVVRVPPDYQPNELKSVAGIERATLSGRVTVEPGFYDHGGDMGPAEAIMHCLLVLDGTILQGNGDDIVGRPGVKSRFVPTRLGWHKQYRVNFFDFTDTEGVFAPNPATESRPLMRSADIFVFFRDCAGGSTSPLCKDISADLAAVSERGVEFDFTGDGDKADNNNVISGFPRTESPTEKDKPYSPLWRVNVVRVIPGHDDDIRLIDSSLEQNETSITDTATIRDYMDQGMLAEAEPMSEAMAGNSIPANNGKVFFNCPSQVPDQ